MVGVGGEGLAPDEFAPVPKGAVVGSDELANAVASEESSGEDGEEEEVVVVARAARKGLEGGEVGEAERRFAVNRVSARFPASPDSSLDKGVFPGGVEIRENVRKEVTSA